MKALRVTGVNKVALLDLPSKKAESGEILLAPIATGICGTDLAIIEGGLDPAFITYPVTIGHEWVGRVIGHGLGVTNPAIGTRVVVEGVIPCEMCSECKSGATNKCDLYDEIGFTRDGAAAQEITAPAKLAHPIKDSVTVESAVLVEPAAVVLQGFHRVSPKAGSKVLVIGDGTIGLLAAKLIRLYKPASVSLLGFRQEQRELVKIAGVDHVYTSEEQLTEKYDLIIEGAGALSAVAAALNHSRRGAHILLLGYPDHGAKLPIVIDDLINNDLTIHASFSYTQKSWAEIVALLNSGKIDLSFIATHKFPLSQWESALATVRGGNHKNNAPRGKVFLTLDVD